MVNLVVATDQINDRRLQSHILKWLRAVANLTKKSDATVNESWLSDIGQALLENLPSWVFSRKSCNYVASKYTFFPSFKEMIDSLKEWAELEDRKKSELNIEHQEAVKNAADLPQPTRNWVLSYVKHSGSNWTMNDTNKPDLNEQKKREKWFEGFMKQQCPEAYKYLFPREWAEQNKTEEQKKIENQGTWVNDAGILHSIKEIETIPSPMLKAVNIRSLKKGVRKYTPEFIGLVEEQYPGSHDEEKEGAIA